VRTLVISQALGVSKPDPRIFREALRRLGAGPGQAVMVGDSMTSDVGGALGAGLKAIRFNPRRLPLPPEIRSPQMTSWRPRSEVLATLFRVAEG